MAENIEKKPDKTAHPNDQERKLESGFGSHWRSMSALIPKMVTEVEIRAAGEGLDKRLLHSKYNTIYKFKLFQQYTSLHLKECGVQ